MSESFIYRELGGPSPRFWGLLALLAIPLAFAAGAYFYMEHYGHIVTGMDNQIVWGLPHVFAMVLIVAATGALNIAMAASVFGKAAYRPLAPLSALVSLALLAGGLALLMLDLGRSDRMVVAAMQLNPASLLSRRVIFYDGYMASVGVYLWFLLERRMNPYVKPVAIIAFFWQLVLITSTGLEFGFNFRAAYDSMLYAPMFIAFASAYGAAVLLLVVLAICRWEARAVPGALLGRLKDWLGISVGASLFFALLLLGTKYELPRSRAVARFLMFDGGVYTGLLWVGQLALGAIVPLALLARAQVSKAALRRRGGAGAPGGLCADVRDAHRRAGLSADPVPGARRIEQLLRWRDPSVCAQPHRVAVRPGRGGPCRGDPRRWAARAGAAARAPGAPRRSERQRTRRRRRRARLAACTACSYRPRTSPRAKRA